MKKTLLSLQCILPLSLLIASQQHDQKIPGTPLNVNSEYSEMPTQEDIIFDQTWDLITSDPEIGGRLNDENEQQLKSIALDAHKNANLSGEAYLDLQDQLKGNFTPEQIDNFYREIIAKDAVATALAPSTPGTNLATSNNTPAAMSGPTHNTQSQSPIATNSSVNLTGGHITSGSISGPIHATNTTFENVNIQGGGNFNNCTLNGCNINNPSSATPQDSTATPLTRSFSANPITATQNDLTSNTAGNPANVTGFNFSGLMTDINTKPAPYRLNAAIRF